MKILGYRDSVRCERATHEYVNEHGIDAYQRFAQEQDQRILWLHEKINANDKDVRPHEAREAVVRLWKEHPIAVRAYPTIVETLHNTDGTKESFDQLMMPGSLLTLSFQAQELEYILKSLNLNRKQEREMKNRERTDMAWTQR